MGNSYIGGVMHDLRLGQRQLALRNRSQSTGEREGSRRERRERTSTEDTADKDAEARIKGPEAKAVKTTFKDHDIMNLGEVQHASMPQVFAALGFHNVPTEIMNKVLSSEQYDPDQDGHSDLKELMKMVHDER